jgi:hypothetical protein
MDCQQELRPNDYRRTNVIYAGAHRRCSLQVHGSDKVEWSAQLGQDQVAELIGMQADGSVVAIVRAHDAADQLSIWRRNQASELLPWFPVGYDTKLTGEARSMERYAGLGERAEARLCSTSGVFCHENADDRLMIFDHRQRDPLVDRTLPRNARVALSPDGLRYATFEAGELRIYSLPQRIH